MFVIVNMKVGCSESVNGLNVLREMLPKAELK